MLQFQPVKNGKKKNIINRFNLVFLGGMFSKNKCLLGFCLETSKSINEIWRDAIIQFYVILKNIRNYFFGFKKRKAYFDGFGLTF